MNYFRPYAVSADETLVAAWDSQVAEIAEDPALAGALARAGLFARFAACHAELKSLPRGARRALQRRLAGAPMPAFSPSRRKKLAYSLAGAALLLALGQPAQAATITVATAIPKINPTDGLCSLIEAIVNANDDAATHPDCAAGSGADTIELPAATTLTLTNTYTHYIGATGLPTITSAITIDGNGAKIAGKKGAQFRLFAVETGGDLTLDNVTLSGGSEKYGGTIFNYGALTVTDSTITGGRAGFGGGVFNAEGAVLTIDGSTISKGTATYGGGIYDDRGTVSIANSTITGNKTFLDGGGVYERSGVFEIAYSTVSKNLSGRDGAGLLASNSAVTIGYSTISGNTAGFFGYGGGLYDRASTTTIENSTITGNKAGAGGGIFNRSTLAVSNSTIVKNSAGDGGGVLNLRDLTLKRTLISGNSAFVGREVDHFSGTVTRNNYNLFGSRGSSGLAGFSRGATDVVPSLATGKIFASLAANGGPTLTHALVAGSPAIDASPADGDCLPADQRGAARPQGAACDIGAFEK